MSQLILDQLLEGNKRFASDTNNYSGVNAKRRLEGLEGQRPKAIIIGCADSRVAPELVFDQGIGDLFVIRVAGNIIDDAIIGSIEYAVSELETSLIMVLGHTNCGAVKASIESEAGDLPGSMGSFVKAIKPAVEEAKALEGDLLTNAIRTNAKYVADRLHSYGHIIPDAIKEGKVMVISAQYHFESGLVEVL